MSKPYTAAQKRAAVARKAKRAKPMKLYKQPRALVIPSDGRRAIYRGHGDYKKSVGYQIGKDIGGAIGYGAQHLIKFLTGFGDYKVTSNSLMGGLYDPPELRNLRDRGVVVRHREYITDINASSAFTLQAFSINAGLPATFPWLSQIAEAFEEYYITGMVFEYKTLSADYTSAASAALGYVVMATQYNSLNPVFPDKKTMENYEFANSAKPSDSFIHPVECKRSITPVSELYVRTGAAPANADLRLYDLGSFQIATGGNSGTGVIGELWVTFEAVLCKPKLVEAIGYDVQTDHYRMTGVADATPLGTAQTLQAGSLLGTTIASNVISMPDNVINGTYLLSYSVSGSALTAVTQHPWTIANGSQLAVWRGGTSSEIANVNTNTLIYMDEFVFRVTGPGCTLTLGTSGTLPTPFTFADLWITQVNGSIIS